MDAPAAEPALPKSAPAIRQVGVEIEFLGPGAAVAASALAADLGGELSAEDPHAWRVRGSRLGDLRVDLDLRHVHPQRHPGLGLDLGPRSAAWLGSVLTPFVPRELITGPLAPERLPDLDAVVGSLRRAGARGRGTVLFDALSLHFNIDPGLVDAEGIAAVLKAYLVLEPELRRAISRGERRLAAVLPPAFPEPYVRRALAPDYWPGLPELAADYLSANPTRKRGLDLLPLLAHIDDPGVRAVLPREKIGRRRVFHYRLPLAHPGEAGWSPLPDWERWRAVEALAADREALARRGRERLAGS